MDILKLLVRRDGTRLGSLAGGEFEEAVAEDCAAALTSARRNQAESRFYSRDGSRLERAAPDYGRRLSVRIRD